MLDVWKGSVYVSQYVQDIFEKYVKFCFYFHEFSLVHTFVFYSEFLFISKQKMVTQIN